jgi:putative DNA primase/helicase
MSQTQVADELNAIFEGRARPVPIPQERAFSELGNAELFEDENWDRLRYCAEYRSWFVYTGTHWKRSIRGEADAAAQDIPRLLYEEAGRETDSDRRKALGKWARQSESARSFKATVEIAKSRSAFAIAAEELDQGSYQLNVANATINLITGVPKPHSPGDLHTKLAPVPFDPDAECPRFVRFLYEVFCGDEALVDFMQRFFGYAATGSVSEQIMVMLYGSGANGKSVLLDVIGHVLGDYVQNARPELLLSTSRGAASEGEANLKGARLVFTSETGTRAQFDEARVKALTGGDKIRARVLWGHEFEFAPTHKLCLQTNHKPKIEGTDYAIWRRVRLIPFDATFRGADADASLAHKLKMESSGILNWIIEGCLKWGAEGLNPPEAVTNATSAYKAESDVLGAFLEECCETGISALSAPAGRLYSAYTTWCQDNGEVADNQRAFSRRIQDRGFRKTRTGSGNRYAGLGMCLKTPD